MQTWHLISVISFSLFVLFMFLSVLLFFIFKINILYSELYRDHHLKKCILQHVYSINLRKKDIKTYRRLFIALLFLILVLLFKHSILYTGASIINDSSLQLTFDDTSIQTVDGIEYFDSSRTAILQINDPEIDEENIKSALHIEISNLNGEHFSSDSSLSSDLAGQSIIDSIIFEKHEDQTSTAYIHFPYEADYHFFIQDPAYASINDFYKQDPSVLYESRFCIDMTAPIVKIQLSGQPEIYTFQNVEEQYFSKTRKAEISIQDTHIDPEDINCFSFYINDYPVSDINWKKTDTDIWIGTANIALEGYIELNAKCMDHSSNMGSILFSGSDSEKNPSIFTIDTQEPLIYVIHHTPKGDDDSETAYFNKKRKITIQIQDTSFSANDPDLFYMQNNEEIIRDFVWNENKDEDDHIVYETTFVFDREDSYNISFYCRDKSGHSTKKVIYTDEDGNEVESPDRFILDFTPPLVNVIYDRNDVKNERFFSTGRTAQILIEDENPSISNCKAEGTAYRKNESFSFPEFSEWKTDTSSLSASLFFEEDGSYHYSLSIKDKAGNAAASIQYLTDTGEKAPAAEDFTIDKSKPTGELIISADDQKAVFTSLQKNDNCIVTPSIPAISVNTDDTISQVYSLQYHAASSYLSDTELKKTDWNSSIDKIVENTVTILYIRIADQAENISFICSSPILIDSLDPEEASVSVSASVSDYGLYHTSVPVSLSVSDCMKTGYASGIKLILCRVFNGNTIQETKLLYQSQREYHSLSSLSSQDPIQKSLTVDARSNEGKSLMLEIEAEDFTGHTSIQRLPIQIDSTSPSILVEFEDEESVQKSKYYSHSRKATITIDDAFFDPDLVTLSITNSNLSIPSLSVWTEKKNGNSIFHTSTILFSEDGDYTFSISCKDKADNKNTTVSYTGGNENSFCIDTKNPTIQLSYDNNIVSNEQYFHADRKLYITVDEHNFDKESFSSLITFQNAKGYTDTAPVLSEWKSSGDIHKASVTFQKEGLYSCNFKMIDLAGNKNTKVNTNHSAAPFRFTIDHTNPLIHITGVQNQKAYAQDISPKIVISDLQLQKTSVILYKSTLQNSRVDVSKDYIKKADLQTNSTGMKSQTIHLTSFAKDRATDGIYELRAIGKDLAGNTSVRTLFFTVNRFGSVYSYNSYTEYIQGKDKSGRYLQRVSEDLTVYEYNPSPVSKDSLSIQLFHDGKLVENVQYSRQELPSSNSLWHKYAYTISKDNFISDGIYQVSVTSHDEAGNSLDSSLSQKGNIQFYLDTTKPEIISIEGLEKSYINRDSQTVSYWIHDNLAVKKITVYLNDSVFLEEEYSDSDENSKIEKKGSFLIKENHAPVNVRFCITDMAGNTFDTEEKDSTGNYLFRPAFSFSHSIIVSDDLYIYLFLHKRISIVLGVSIFTFVTLILLFIYRKIRFSK